MSYKIMSSVCLFDISLKGYQQVSRAANYGIFSNSDGNYWEITNIYLVRMMSLKRRERLSGVSRSTKISTTRDTRKIACRL